MVLRHREQTMSSEQPVKKKLRRGDVAETTDEPDYIHTLAENGMRNDLSALHLSLPPNVNEADLTRNTLNTQLHNAVIEHNKPIYRTSDHNSEKTDSGLVILNPICAINDVSEENLGIEVAVCSKTVDMAAVKLVRKVCDTTDVSENHLHSQSSSDYLPNYINTNGLISNSGNKQLLAPTVQSYSQLNEIHHITNHDRQDSQVTGSDSFQINNLTEFELVNSCKNELDKFYKCLMRHCLCGISEITLRKPFESNTNNSGTSTLIEWPTAKILQFLSNLQLLFDVYLKQNHRGFICSRIVGICNSLVQNEYNLIEQIISLCDTRNKYINYLSARVLSSFLIIAKTNVNNEWLETIVGYLSLENIDYTKMNFALEVIKKVVEWKDVEIHVLEDSSLHDSGAGTSSQISNYETNCVTVQFSDAESFDTSAIKCLTIRSLESKWPDLISNIQYLISHNNSVQSQTCILTFLSLWESTISVKANLSVIDTKPFYAHLENFVGLLNGALPPIIWKQLLSLFNEVLCYGSTLALQDMLPEDTCQLAHLIVRYVKDFRLLDSLPYRRNEGHTVHSFAGTIPSTVPEQTIDKTLLQKMVLLVLKSVAVTIKETRSDSSDSSVGSDDYDFYQDMQLIERSIRDVLMKVDVFVKNSLDFHPETPFSKLVVNLFSDQDDYLIESMVCTLDFTVGMSYRNALFPDLVSILNPVYSFIEFLKVVSHDSDVLLDYLVSNETCFLLYLLRFLKYIRKNWSIFVSSCENSGTNELENTMTVLIRLKTQINRLVSRHLFPYNISPVIRLLDACENMYEGNEFS